MCPDKHSNAWVAAGVAFVVGFRDGGIQRTGTAITKVLPPVSRFAPEGGLGEKKQRVLTTLAAFFERFSGLGAGG